MHGVSIREVDLISRFRQYWYDMKSSFWFVPGLILVGAIILAIVLINVDVLISPEIIENWPRLLGAGAESSRNLLETIATSMITVAGVVFSITLVALSLASSQYSSRVLNTFMNDRTNQIVLGVFVGIFAYCLVVIRTIKDTEEGFFVPELAVLFGLILGIVGIAFLVFFIHHIATSIQASQILLTVFEETIENIDSTFDEQLEAENFVVHAEPNRPGKNWYTVLSTQTGYIQQIDMRPLLTFARQEEAVVSLERGIGEFLIAGAPALSVFHADPPDDKIVRNLNGAFTLGRQRTPYKDVAYGIRQLVDVALKALSPGVNDTTTAVMVIDYLTAILVHLADRPIETPYIIEDDDLRVLLRGPTYTILVAEAFKQICQNAEGNKAILIRLFGSLEVLAGQTKDTKRRQVLLMHARDMVETARRSVASTSDRQEIQDLSTRVIDLLDVPEEKPTG